MTCKIADLSEWVGSPVRWIVIEEGQVVVCINGTMDSTDPSVRLRFTDDGQQCCEHRYFTCDDDPSAIIARTTGGSARLVGVRLSEVCDESFLTKTTTAGSITVVAHNEHNGYYAGFDVCVSVEKDLGSMPVESTKD